MKASSQPVNDNSLKAPIDLTPIGIFKSAAIYPYEVPRQGCFADNSTAQVELWSTNENLQALDQIETFSHIWLLYLFHHNNDWHPKVMPPRGSQQKVGVFASRSPYRPNPIGLSCVQLLSRQETRLIVSHHDLLDGTPILDIKPYIAKSDSVPEASMGWFVQPHHHQIIWTALAHEQVEWIEQSTLRKLRQFINTQLEVEPLNHKKKRVKLLSSSPRPPHDAVLAFRTWRCHFRLEDSQQIKILFMDSGYSIDDLASNSDPYHDKEIHRLFLSHFS